MEAHPYCNINKRLLISLSQLVTIYMDLDLRLFYNCGEGVEREPGEAQLLSSWTVNELPLSRIYVVCRKSRRIILGVITHMCAHRSINRAVEK